MQQNHDVTITVDSGDPYFQFTMYDADPLFQPSENHYGMIGDYGNRWYECYIDYVHYNYLYQTSDIRLKKNISPYKNSLAELKKIDVIKFDYNEAAFKNSKPERLTELMEQGKNNIGCSAQQLQTVFPNLVNVDKDSTMSVNYVGLVPVLVQSVKEQQEQIEDLKKEIELLKKLLLDKQIADNTDNVKE